MEYGKVCVVVVNHGTKLSETLADIAENLTTDCVWKVLVSHEPIYGTESVSATPAILASICLLYTSQAWRRTHRG